MTKWLIGTNLKMYKSIAETVIYANELKKMATKYGDSIQLFVIPAHTSIQSVQHVIKNKNILLGAQNMHWEQQGPYTGEISPIHLNELAVEIVELGHSERRQYFNENDYTVHLKVKSALEHSLTPLICIGETLQQKEHGISEAFIALQLQTIFSDIDLCSESLPWIAYEPRWAIGENGVEADVVDVQKMHTFIRQQLVKQFGNIAYDVPLLFGGSVHEKNASTYLSCSDVDGLFIGRAAWDIERFSAILQNVYTLQK